MRRTCTGPRVSLFWLEQWSEQPLLTAVRRTNEGSVYGAGLLYLSGAHNDALGAYVRVSLYGDNSTKLSVTGAFLGTIIDRSAACAHLPSAKHKLNTLPYLFSKLAEK